MMSRDASLSESSTPDRCSFSRVNGMYVIVSCNGGTMQFGAKYIHNI